MKRFCKNILPISLALILGLTSCGDKDIDPVDPVDSTEIQFGKVTTRSLTNPTDGEAFRVWAAASNEWTNGYQAILDAEEMIYYDAGKAQWTYDNKMYWGNDTHHYFIATYPFNADWKFDQNVVDNGGQDFVIYTMRVNTGSEANTDILTAYNHTYTGDDGFAPADPVHLDFTHLLTKVNFKISQNFDIDPDFNYYVTKVTLTGIKTSGTYMVGPYNASLLQYWNMEEAEELTFVKEYNEPVILRGNNPADPKVILSVWNDGLMLIPQPIALEQVKIRVDFLYDVNLNDESMGTPDFIEGHLPPADDDLWQSGKSITYSLAIADQSPITFSNPTISPWATPQTGGTIIIK